MLNGALVIEIISNVFSKGNKNFGHLVVKNVFPLDFIKYLSYSEVQEKSKVVNVQIRSLRVFSKSFTETIYWNKFFVSECIFKFSLSLGDKKFVVRKRYPRKIFEQNVTVAYFKNQSSEVFCKKSALENLANFTGKYLCWSLFLMNLQA